MALHIGCVASLLISGGMGKARCISSIVILAYRLYSLISYATITKGSDNLPKTNKGLVSPSDPCWTPLVAVHSSQGLLLKKKGFSKYYLDRLKVVVEWLGLLLCIREYLGSNLDP
jgi:hypothetical protein